LKCLLSSSYNGLYGISNARSNASSILKLPQLWEFESPIYIFESVKLTLQFVNKLLVPPALDMDTRFNGLICLNSFKLNTPTNEGYHFFKNSCSAFIWLYINVFEESVTSSSSYTSLKPPYFVKLSDIKVWF
jgi:hypothetical protein